MSVEKVVEKHSINVELCGYVFSLSVTPENEETLRAAAKDVNSVVSAIKDRTRSKYDFAQALALAALQFASNVKQEKKATSESEFIVPLEAINDKLDALLNEE